MTDLCPLCGAYWEGCDCRDSPEKEPEPSVEMSPEDIEFWLELNAAAISERDNLT